ncbi:MAG TPA: hypothetical protein VF509_02395 [Sphingobium sp.]
MPTARQRAKITAPPRKGAAWSGAMFGIEILRPEGWVPLKTVFGHRVRTFGSMAEAMDACILHWRKTGHGARPFRVTAR